ncbi:lipoprotein (plasmid) [Borreliella finlandensis]|uniref:Lipoprotein n=1 Tax=Borreliella finlandensis TaxID=498741 RepID=A0A806C6K5_9SPIR|nr:lipoprotein [Borreliella finlandensis]
MGNAGEFNKLLGNDESKIKSALDHIKTELDKCSENNEGKNTLKEIVKEAFGGGIEKITTEATTTCNQ